MSHVSATPVDCRGFQQHRHRWPCSCFGAAQASRLRGHRLLTPTSLRVFVWLVLALGLWVTRRSWTLLLAPLLVWAVLPHPALFAHTAVTQANVQVLALTAAVLALPGRRPVTGHPVMGHPVARLMAGPAAATGPGGSRRPAADLSLGAAGSGGARQ